MVDINAIIETVANEHTRNHYSDYDTGWQDCVSKIKELLGDVDVSIDGKTLYITNRGTLNITR